MQLVVSGIMSRFTFLCTALACVLLLLPCDGLTQNCKSGFSDDSDEEKALWKCQKESGIDDREIVDKLDSK